MESDYFENQPKNDEKEIEWVCLWSNDDKAERYLYLMYAKMTVEWK